MSDYLTRLAARSLSLTEVIRPRLPSLFEPPPEADQFVLAQRPGAEMSDVDSTLNGSDSQVFTPRRPLVPSLVRGPSEERPSVEKSPAPLNMSHQARSGSTETPDLHAGQPSDQPLMPQTPAAFQRIEARSERPRTDLSPAQEQPAPRQTGAQVFPPMADRLPDSRARQQDPGKPKPFQEFIREETVSRPPSSAAKQLPHPQIAPAVERTVVERFAVYEEPSQPSAEDPTRAASHRAVTGRQHAPFDATDRVLIEQLVSPERPRSPVIAHLEPSENQPLRTPTPARILAQPRLVVPHVQLKANAPAETTAKPAPTIQVTIGRIEVRATPPPSQPPQRQRSVPPVMSLEEYLRQRSGEKS